MELSGDTTRPRTLLVSPWWTSYDQRFAKEPKLAKEISSRFGGPEMQTSVTNTPPRSFGLIMIVLFDPWSRPPSID